MSIHVYDACTYYTDNNVTVGCPDAFPGLTTRLPKLKAFSVYDMRLTNMMYTKL